MSGIRLSGCLINMKQLKIFVSILKNCSQTLWLFAMLFIYNQGFSQDSGGWKLEKMPVDLETEFALSALPPHLRDSATVYLLDPMKGYYIGRQGTNGFSAFVDRTDWEWAEFIQDNYAAISYDSEGSKTYLPVFFAVAEMRASGKYSPLEIREIIIKRVKDGTYKAPSRVGVSYMLSPLLRTHPGQSKEIVNMVMPHYMFYAPRVDNSDIGGVWDEHSPYAIGTGDVLDKNHSIFNYIIIPAGDMEKAKIVEANKDLLKKLAAYKPYLNVEPSMASHTH
jgi:hypothetical protein